MSTQTFRRKLHIGDEKNYLLVGDYGELTWAGEGITWEDIQSPLLGKRLSTAAGGVAYNYAEESVTFSPSGVISDLDDVVGMSIQYPHKAKADGVLKLHIHWWQPDATEREFSVKYRVQTNGSAKATAWTTVVVPTSAANNAFTYPGSGTINQITRLVEIDMSAYGLSSILQVQVARTDAEAGNIDATFLDLHYQIDSVGSTTEFVK